MNLKLLIACLSYEQEGWTPLMMACQVGNLSCAQYLVSKGVDPTVTNKVLVFCPHLCRKYCTIHAVCFLQLQTTALMIACFEGHIPVLEWLLSVGVDPHASDKVRSRVKVCYLSNQEFLILVIFDVLYRGFPVFLTVWLVGVSLRVQTRPIGGVEVAGQSRSVTNQLY